MSGALKLNLTFHDLIDVENEGENKKQDCGTRTAVLPLPLPPVGDDFVWEARDFDGFRMAMLEELAARFPERTQWTPADLEVVLVEVLSWALDQLSDMLDRVTAEAYLETARRPESVRRLLELIGYEADEREWLRNPLSMEAARRAGPKAVRQQRRMVSVDDYAAGIEMHPLVRRAVSSTRWNGSWHCILVTVILWGWRSLEDHLPEGFWNALRNFHKQHGFPLLDGNGFPLLDANGFPLLDDETLESIRIIDALKAWADSRRMVGQEVVFGEAIRVGVDIGLDIHVADQYYQSEVLQAVRSIFNEQEGGFFEIGRLSFGTHLHRSDVIEAVMQLEGIERVDVKTFKRHDSDTKQLEDKIALEGFEVAVCDNKPTTPEYGLLTVRCAKGGLKG